MVIVALKDGYAFSFEMASWDKEKMLVEKFKSGGLSQTTTLDLKSKGSYKVSEIEGMDFQPVKVIKKEEPKEKTKEEKMEAFKEAMRKHKKKNEEDRLNEFAKAFRQAANEKKKS